MQKYFNEIADNRHQSYVKHRLQDILVMIMCAVLDITLPFPFRPTIVSLRCGVPIMVDGFI